VRLAIVGAGVSGLVTAYLVSRAHDVVLFERNNYFGGHSHTIRHSTPEGEIALDTGFIVYNQPAYPRFSRLLAELRVPTQPSEMSFSVTCHACQLAYSSRGLAGMLARPRGMLRPQGLQLAIDVLRFYRRAPRDATRKDIRTLTLSQYLKQRRFSDEFRRHFIVPLAASVWSMPPEEVAAFPAAYLLRFLLNHGLIGDDPSRWQWRTVTGGSKAYVQAILSHLRERARGTRVCRIQRGESGVTVWTAGGASESFDAVVLACHADEALSLLTDADCLEAAALSRLTSTSNRVVLHTDETLLPAQPAARASWNYVTQDCRSRDGLSLTYLLNRLQSIDAPRQYCVSVNPTSPIARDAVIDEMTYAHPRYTFETLAAQRQLLEINGRNGTYFAGAYLGYGFHEDGVESAYRVAALLGVEA
jgi:predicted NAD/FAD-binding protein